MDFPSLIRFGAQRRPQPGDPDWMPANQYAPATGIPEFDADRTGSYFSRGQRSYDLPSDQDFSSSNATGSFLGQSLYDLPTAMALGADPTGAPPAPMTRATAIANRDPATAARIAQEGIDYRASLPAIMKGGPGSADLKGGDYDPAPIVDSLPAAMTGTQPAFKLRHFSGLQALPASASLLTGDAGMNNAAEQERRMEYAQIKAMGMSPAEYEAYANQAQPTPARFTRSFTNGVLGGGDFTQNMVATPGGVRFAGTGTGRDGMPYVQDVGQPEYQAQAKTANDYFTELAKNQAMQDPKTQAALAIQDLQGKYNVEEAAARRHDVINSKLMEAALFNQQRTFEATGDEAAARDAFNRTMRIAGAAVPGATLAAAGGTPGALVGQTPLSPSAIGERSMGEELASLVRNAEYNTGSAKEMLATITRIKDPEIRKAAIATAISRNRGVDQLGDQVALAAANDFLMANPENYKNFTPEETGLPIGMQLDTPSFLGIRTQTPTLRIGGRTIDFPMSARPGQGANPLASNATLRDAVARRAAAAEFLNALINAGYGK